MPNRIIRDASKTSPSLAALSDFAERTFWRVIVTLDDFGRYHGSPMALFAAAYPVETAGCSMKKFLAALKELEAGDLLRFYESGGRRYVYSPTWTKYQRLRAIASLYPEPLCSVGRGHHAVNPPPSAPGDGVGIGVGDGNGVPPRSRPRHAAREERTEGFEAFWLEYPRKRKKGDARKAWTALAPDRTLTDRIMAAVAAARVSHDWRKEGGKFVPYPATWIRAEGWEDTFDARAPSTTVDDILRAAKGDT